MSTPGYVGAIDDEGIFRGGALATMRYWMQERHAIWQRKEAGLPRSEWTKDPILQAWRFCNVYRELDTTTIWIRKNWREPFADHPNLWFFMAMARWTNLIGTMEHITRWLPMPFDSYTKDVEHHLSVVMKDHQVNNKVFTSAYMLPGSLRGAGTNKVDHYTTLVLRPLWDGFNRDVLAPGASLESVWAELAKFPGFRGGGFLAYEVVTDLRHTRYLRDAPDTNTWANAGPGAIRGLNRLFGRELDAPMSKKQSNAEMAELLAPAREWMNNSTLEMRDIEHTLCEVDKYVRVRERTGTPRQRYVPANAA